MLNNAGIYRQHIHQKLFLKIGLRLATHRVKVSLERNLIKIHPLRKRGSQPDLSKIKSPKSPIVFLKI